MLHPLTNFEDIIDDNIENKKVATITFQVTENCNFACTYCYQHNKTTNHMSLDIAKLTIDKLLANAENPNAYFSVHKFSGLIIEFIGGEPLLEIDLIQQIIEYFEYCLNIKYPHLIWTFYHRYLITTNGYLYNTEKVQYLLNHYSSILSMVITVDGNEKAHNLCRRTKTGEPTYRTVLEAAIQNREEHANYTTKLTISPENIKYLYDSITFLISIGFSHICATFTFEEGWTFEHAQLCLKELKKVNDWLIKNNMTDLCYISLLDIESIKQSPRIENWCGFNSSMLAIDYQGNIFPCTRFMDISLNNKQPPYIIGNIFDGLGTNLEEQQRLNDFKILNCQNQSEQKCLECFCSAGCAWCSAYNYEYYGTIFKRTTFHCELQEACAIATQDLYNKLNQQNKINIPQSIIDKFS